MDKSYEQEYFKLEKEYWWFKARRHLIKKIKIKPNQKILEVGCGTGLNLNLFPKNQRHGIDISKEAIKQIKDFPAEVADIQKVKLKKYDIILALDLIEHLDKDKQTLQKLTNALNPKGKLIITVPAFKCLWSKHDEVNHHKRRYNRKQFKTILPKQLKTNILTYWNFSLFPIVFILNKLNKKKSNLKPINPVLNFIFYNKLKLENWLITQGINFPFGTSIFYIGEKTDK
ncbi:methyltransferase domain-containing protein [archaeon]|jgi:trans-aconitate methyltransferase|nr:methyltransferase domain-containing protein [archaeon]MBT4416965.1 methyltransferase domain-containing protein [archaeon]